MNATRFHRGGRTGRYHAGDELQHHIHQGGSMYEKPRVERFGSFRELTQSGSPDVAFDGLIMCNNQLVSDIGRSGVPIPDGF